MVCFLDRAMIEKNTVNGISTGGIRRINVIIWNLYYHRTLAIILDYMARGV